MLLLLRVHNYSIAQIDTNDKTDKPIAFINQRVIGNFIIL